MTSLSSALAGYPHDESYQFLISDAFFELARSRAQSSIGRKYKGCISAGGVANSALNAALGWLGSGKLKSPTQEDFERVLRQIVRFKLVDRIRHHSQERRDREKLASVEPEFLANLPTRSDDPAALAEINELCDTGVFARLVASARHLLEKRFGGNARDAKLRLWVANTAIDGHLPASKIQAMMKTEFPNDVPYSERNIQVIRAHARKFLYSWLLEIEEENEQ